MDTFPVYIDHFDTILGEMTIGIYRDAICFLAFSNTSSSKKLLKEVCDDLQTTTVREHHPLRDSVVLTLIDFLNGNSKELNFPVCFTGTAFQQQVWKEVMNIPYGETISYGSLARRMKNDKGIRAIASANGANRILLRVPCHRVTGAGGELTGYSGGITRKQQLLEAEQIHSGKGQSRLELF